VRAVGSRAESALTCFPHISTRCETLSSAISDTMLLFHRLESLSVSILGQVMNLHYFWRYPNLRTETPRLYFLGRMVGVMIHKRTFSQSRYSGHWFNKASCMMTPSLAHMRLKPRGGRCTRGGLKRLCQGHALAIRDTDSRVHQIRAE
jgi:hypothetical protein